jgi:hypothetical protein
MSLNVENKGSPVALLDVKGNKQIVCVSDGKDYVVNPMSELRVLDGILQPIPNTTKERNIIYVCGQSGSGKSYYIGEYIKQYKKLYPKNEIYLFSALSEDPSLDKIKGINRIDLEKLNEIDLELDEFQDTFLIFDDIDTLKKGEIRTKIFQLLDECLQIGRHKNISVAYVSHVCTKGKETQLILNEAHAITFFPKTMGNRNIKYLCGEYLGLDKQEIQRLKSMDSRFVTVCKTFPKCVLGSKEIFIQK